MPGALDKAMGKVAKTLIGTLGRSATLRRAPAPEAGYTGSAPAGSSTDYPCEVALTEFDDRQIDGTTIRLGDRKALVSRLRLGFEPKPDRDTLIESGRTWRVLRVLGISSGAQEAAYVLHVRT